MNEQTERLIRELAAKLGTTAEHLWGVLVRQAYINGITNLLVIAGWTLLVLIGYRLVRRKTTVPAKTEEEQYPSAEWHEIGAAIAWLVLGTAVICGISTLGSSLYDIAGSLLNPEYWALKQIIK